LRNAARTRPFNIFITAFLISGIAVCLAAKSPKDTLEDCPFRPQRLWPRDQNNKIVIPYTTSNLGAGDAAGLDMAILEWTRSGKVTFYPIKASDPSCGSLLVTKKVPNNNRCVSTLGYNGKSKANILAVDGCNLDTIWQDLVHELGHVIGLGHENQRNDRNKYISFVDDPKYPRWVRCDIKEVDPEPSSGDYNFRSFMHYPLILPSNGAWDNIWSGRRIPADRRIFKLNGSAGKEQLAKTWPEAQEEWVGNDNYLTSIGEGDLKTIDRLYAEAAQPNSKIKVISMDEICKKPAP
jgi:hypothetical protein